jgi:hypothetical protein
MNGWRIVSGQFDANGKIHTDARELELRQRDGGLKGLSD